MCFAGRVRNNVSLVCCICLSSSVCRSTNTQTVLGVYLKRTCSRDSSASSALGVLNGYALYKSTHSLSRIDRHTGRLIAILGREETAVCRCNQLIAIEPSRLQLRFMSTIISVTRNGDLKRHFYSAISRCSYELSDNAAAINRTEHYCTRWPEKTTYWTVFQQSKYFLHFE